MSAHGSLCQATSSKAKTPFATLPSPSPSRCPATQTAARLLSTPAYLFFLVFLSAALSPVLIKGGKKATAFINAGGKSNSAERSLILGNEYPTSREPYRPKFTQHLFSVAIQTRTTIIHTDQERKKYLQFPSSFLCSMCPTLHIIWATMLWAGKSGGDKDTKNVLCFAI